MFTRFVIYPYKMSSSSARHLARALGGMLVRPDGNYRYRPGDLVINWGTSQWPEWDTRDMRECLLNPPQNVKLATSKIATFRRLAENPTTRKFIPEFTCNPVAATNWVMRRPKYPGHIHAVLCRTLDSAHGGRGIVLARRREEIVPAPLYTRYVPKQHEYRIHVFGGRVIAIQEKRKRNGFRDEGNNKYICNHMNGWVFCRKDIQLPIEHDLENIAACAVQTIGLDFGVVDIGYHNEYGPCVYEINTAPGIEGTTIDDYATAIRNY